MSKWYPVLIMPLMVNSDEFQLFEYFALPIICRMADYLKTFVCTQNDI